MNYVRTAILLAALTGLFVGIGFLIGGQAGMVIAFLIAVAMNVFTYWNADRIVLRMYNAHEVDRSSAPQFHQIVEQLAQRAGLPMPRVYVIEDDQPNAFATGRNPANAAIAVTSGIQRALPPEELEGVLAHEMAHIANRDILIASVAAMVAGAISAIVNFLQFSMLFGGGDDDSPLGFVGTLLAIILAPIVAIIIQMSISRQREYRADAVGAELLGDPIPLANALVRLHHGAQAIPMEVNQAAAPLYIVNPLAGGTGRKMASLFSTHPPMEERVRRLRQMAGPRIGSNPA